MTKRGVSNRRVEDKNNRRRPFWDVDSPKATKNPENRPGHQQQTTKCDNSKQPPLQEGEINSDSDQDPSILKVPAVNWAKYVGVKSVQYIKLGYAPRTTAEEPNDWDLGNAVRESEKNFSTDLQLLMTETTNDPTLLKTLVCLERQQLDNIPEKYLPNKRQLNQIRSRVLPRPYDCPEKPQNNCDQPPLRGPSRYHQQDLR